MTITRLSRAVIARRLLILLAALALTAGIAACGSSHPHQAAGEATGNNAADANNNGAYVFAGPITYQLQISRQLNQYSVEDSQYIKGLPSGTPAPNSQQFWYGVFLWAKNQTHQAATVSDNFKIVDTQGDTYYPLKLDPSLNPFAWQPFRLEPLQTVPQPGTIMANGPTQGGLLLFKVPYTVYDDRPLTLYIMGAQNQKLGSISLNL